MNLIRTIIGLTARTASSLCALHEAYPSKPDGGGS